MKLDEVKSLLQDFLPQDGKPVVAYAGLFPLARALEAPTDQLASRILDILLDVVGPERTLIMPTYTNGFDTGFLNLDTEPANTGMVNELLRNKPGALRTAASFWSFAAFGPEAKKLADLRPQDAWGDGSVFDWIHQSAAHILIFGAPWAMCSFLHRVEWLAQVPYRYTKDFLGEILLRGNKEILKERLFVRCRQPNAQNIWPDLETRLKPGGMRLVPVGRGYIATMTSTQLINTLLPIIQADPFSFVKNPEVLREHFASPVEK